MDANQEYLIFGVTLLLEDVRQAKPAIHGTQTATVVGPTQHEVHTDQYARVRVQFAWDRQGQWDAGSSCWIRVSTPTQGSQYGSTHLPHVGQEVMVSWLNGDVDRPIILGVLPNQLNMPSANSSQPPCGIECPAHNQASI